MRFSCCHPRPSSSGVSLCFLKLLLTDLEQPACGCLPALCLWGLVSDFTREAPEGSFVTSRRPAGGSISGDMAEVCLSMFMKYVLVRGAWVAQSVKRHFSSGMISQFTGSSPASGSVLKAQSLEPASDCVSLSAPLPPTLSLSS